MADTRFRMNDRRSFQKENSSAALFSVPNTRPIILNSSSRASISARPIAAVTTGMPRVSIFLLARGEVMPAMTRSGFSVMILSMLTFSKEPASSVAAKRGYIFRRFGKRRMEGWATILSAAPITDTSWVAPP